MKDHLLDGRTYRRLSQADCANNKTRIEEELKSWMKKFNKTLTKMERAFLKQGLEKNKKAFAGFYLTLKAHKLKPGQNVRHLKIDQSSHAQGAYYTPWVSGSIENYKSLRNNKNLTFGIASNYANNYVRPHIQQMPNFSPRMQYQCIRTSLETQR